MARIRQREATDANTSYVIPSIWYPLHTIPIHVWSVKLIEHGKHLLASINSALAADALPANAADIWNYLLRLFECCRWRPCILQINVNIYLKFKHYYLASIISKCFSTSNMKILFQILLCAVWQYHNIMLVLFLNDFQLQKWESYSKCCTFELIAISYMPSPIIIM